MSNTRSLIVNVVGDSRSFERALSRSSTAASKFQRDVDRVSGASGKLNKLSALKGFGAGLVASEGVRLVKDLVGEASNLNEQTAKSQIVFGQSAAAIKAWSETTAGAYGISQTAALEAAGTIGTITRSMGLSETAAADMSRSLVDLAGDLASFNNTSSDDALVALRSAIVGEYEPLRRLGSALSEARVQQQAMIETGKQSARELTSREKVTARYNLILKDTALAQGDAARTSETFANQTRQLSAKADELQANLGNLLLPAVTDLVGVLNDGASAALALGDALKSVGDIDLGPLGKVGDVIGEIKDSAIDKVAPFARPILSAVDYFSGDESSASGAPATDPSGGLTGLFSRLSKTAPASIFESQKNPINNLPTGFQNMLLKARNEQDSQGLRRGLIKGKQFYEVQLQRAIDADDSKAVNTIRENLLGIQQAIQGSYADSASATEATKRAADAAAEQAADASRDAASALKAKAASDRREADERKAKLAANAQRLADAVKDQQQAAADALKDQADALRARAEKFKQGVLNALDRKQEGVDVSRDLRDAQDQLKIARAVGGKIGLRNAIEGVADARRSEARFRAEGATFTGNAAGGVNIASSVININGADDPEAIARKVMQHLQRRGKQHAPQFTGRAPGGIYGIPH